MLILNIISATRTADLAVTKRKYHTETIPV